MSTISEKKVDNVAKDVKEVKEKDVAEVKKESTPVVTQTKKSDSIKHKLYIQYNDLEFSDELMFEAAAKAYCTTSGQDKSLIESVTLYVKPQEGKAYYVINDDAEKTGSIDL